MAVVAHSRLEELAWAQIEPKATAVPKDLRTALKYLLKSGDKLWTATYPYSDLIVSNGSLKFPDEAVPADTSRLKDLWGEKPPPLCLVLSGSVEVFLDVPKVRNTFPLQLIGPGEMFGVFEALDRLYGEEDSLGFYSASSGCRSIWILGGRLKAEDLPKKVGIKLGLSRNLTWKHKADFPYQFVQRAMKPSNPWHCEVLFLPTVFVKRAMQNRTFQHLLYRLGWTQSAHARRQISAYSETEYVQMQKPGYQHLVRHLNSIRLGQLPAFRLSHRVPVSSGPFQEFQEKLYEVLLEESSPARKAHFPFILQPAQLQKPDEIGFYSLKEPQPYLSPDNKPATKQCEHVTDFLKDHRDHYRFFCNGADGKPYTNNPLLANHYQLTIKDFVDSPGTPGGFPPGDLTSEQICLADGFLNTGVMVSR